jgi:hypothetical protein
MECGENTCMGSDVGRISLSATKTDLRKKIVVPLIHANESDLDVFNFDGKLCKN